MLGLPSAGIDIVERRRSGRESGEGCAVESGVGGGGDVEQEFVGFGGWDRYGADEHWDESGIEVGGDGESGGAGFACA